MSGRGSFGRQLVGALVAFSTLAVTLNIGSALAEDDKEDGFTPRSVEAAAAPEVPSWVRETHAADVAVARSLESSRVVSLDEEGPVPIPVDGRVVGPPGAADLAPLPALDVPVVDVEVVESVVPRAVSGFDPATSVELVGERSEFSTTFENADRTRAVLLSSVPVHFVNSDGAWSRIDNHLVADGRGGFVHDLPL